MGRNSSISPNGRGPSREVGLREQRTVDRLVAFYSVMGNLPDAPGALSTMASMLCKRLTDEQIGRRLERCAVECHYPVRLPDIFARAGVGAETAPEDAEMRRAWDVLINYVDRHVQSDPHGNYSPRHDYWGKPAPELSEQITDTVRRTGGWRAYKTMADRDFPYQQRRFFEEYLAWTAVAKLSAGKMLATPTCRALPISYSPPPENDTAEEPES